MRTTVRLAMAKTPTDALTKNAMAEAHIVDKNRSRKNMKNLLALACNPAISERPFLLDRRVCTNVTKVTKH